MEYEELRSYLKDVYEIEKQLHSLREVANLYENEIDWYNEEFKKLYEGEVLLGDRKQILNEVNPPEQLLEVGSVLSYTPWRIMEPPIPKRWNWFETIAPYLKPYEKRSLFSKRVDFKGTTAIFMQGTELFNQVFDCYTRLYNNDLEKRNAMMRPVCEKRTQEYTEQILATISNSEKLLTQLYAQDIIHPKYRNFLAIAQIYEYFDTGRCTELGGANGAYNLYESELRQNIIIDRLDVIVSQLQMLNRTI